MVIFGGLELVAAGVIIHKLNKNKERRLEEEAEDHRRQEKHDRKHHHRRHSPPHKRYNGSLQPPSGVPPRAQSAPPGPYHPDRQPQPGHYPAQPWQPQYQQTAPSWQPQQHSVVPMWQPQQPHPNLPTQYNPISQRDPTAQYNPVPQPRAQPQQTEPNWYADQPKDVEASIAGPFPPQSPPPSYGPPLSRNSTGSVSPPRPQSRERIRPVTTGVSALTASPRPEPSRPVAVGSVSADFVELSADSPSAHNHQPSHVMSDTASQASTRYELQDYDHPDPPPAYQPYRSQWK